MDDKAAFVCNYDTVVKGLYPIIPLDMLESRFEAVNDPALLTKLNKGVALARMIWEGKRNGNVTTYKRKKSPFKPTRLHKRD